MELSPRDYLIFYIAVVTAIVVSFLVLRKKRQPTRLNLRTSLPPSEASRVEKPSATRPGKDSPQNEAARASRYSAALADLEGSESSDLSTSRETKPAGDISRSLNVLFQWNGHTWDAYEALGLPAGSRPESAREAYSRLLTQGDPNSMLFFKAAYEAILKQKN